MRASEPSRPHSSELSKAVRRPLDLAADDDSGQHGADDVLAEIGLVLVVVLGVILAVNAVLISLHITP